tara:strand:+ start:1143 stop:1439 length:297 start_codon:yes stop_codon:yes gene_type:complete
MTRGSEEEEGGGACPQEERGHYKPTKKGVFLFSFSRISAPQSPCGGNFGGRAMREKWEIKTPPFKNIINGHEELLPKPLWDTKNYFLSYFNACQVYGL